MNFSIGEFSRMTRVTVKALRLYHERGILVPDFVDPESGYRYYAKDQVNDARVVQSLKAMDFSLSEIRDVLDECNEDGDLLGVLQRKRNELEGKVRSYRKSIEEIELILRLEKGGEAVASEGFEVVEKLVPDSLIAGIRKLGRYGEIDKEFKMLGRHAGRVATGKAMCLYYDGEYKENDADFEVCFEVKRGIEKEGIACRELSGGSALSVMHLGPYEKLGRAYGLLFEALKQSDAVSKRPIREIYHKGPGFILKGNPEKYLTEVQVLVEV